MYSADFGYPDEPLLSAFTGCYREITYLGMTQLTNQMQVFHSRVIIFDKCHIKFSLPLGTNFAPLYCYVAALTHTWSFRDIYFDTHIALSIFR